jgi:hypothetical protein
MGGPGRAAKRTLPAFRHVLACRLDDLVRVLHHARWNASFQVSIGGSQPQEQVRVCPVIASADCGYLGDNRSDFAAVELEARVQGFPPPFDPDESAFLSQLVDSFPVRPAAAEARGGSAAVEQSVLPGNGGPTIFSPPQGPSHSRAGYRWRAAASIVSVLVHALQSIHLRHPRYRGRPCRTSREQELAPERVVIQDPPGPTRASQ